MDVKQRLKVLFESTTPIVIMETLEEARALRLIHDAADELQLAVFEWSLADGLSRSGGGSVPPPVPTSSSGVRDRAQLRIDGAAPNSIYNTKEAVQVLSQLQTISSAAVFVLKDIHRQIDDPLVVRMMREAAQDGAHARRTMVITAPSLTPPPELQNELEYVELPLPERARLKEIIISEFARLGAQRKLQNALSAAAMDAMAGNLCGLTEREAERAVAASVASRGGLFPESVKDVMNAKRELLRRSGSLEFIPAEDGLAVVGGLDNLKDWLRKRQSAFSEAARAARLEPPKGVIILGVQGCGKSLCARTIAGEWQLPMVKFDSSQIFDKYIGESEKRIKRLFRTAEQLAPCVLWIDEMEKLMAGSGAAAADSDGGTSARLLGAFLSWMQDRKVPVFVAATCNNVDALPPELIRKGRFDEVFFVDLPNQAEREAIFNVQLKRRTMDPAKFEVKRLVAASQGFSGAEIEAAIQSAMYACFADKTTISTEAILHEISATVPLSITRAEEIDRLRAWASKRCISASRAVTCASA